MRSPYFHEEIKSKADKISNLILYSDLDFVDIAIEVENLREELKQEAPEYIDLFEMIYVSRFTRLWEQWGKDNEGRRMKNEG